MEYITNEENGDRNKFNLTFFLLRIRHEYWQIDLLLLLLGLEAIELSIIITI